MIDFNLNNLRSFRMPNHRGTLLVEYPSWIPENVARNEAVKFLESPVGSEADILELTANYSDVYNPLTWRSQLSP